MYGYKSSDDDDVPTDDDSETEAKLARALEEGLGLTGNQKLDGE